MEGHPMALSVNPTRRQAEAGFAATLFTVAAWGWVEASDYAGASGTYPQVLCALMMICSVLVILRLALSANAVAQGNLLDHAPRFFLGFGAIGAYIVAIDMVGYMLPSLAFGIGLPVSLGYRNFRLIVPVVVGVIAFIYLVFGVMLERPFPPDILLEMFL